MLKILSRVAWQSVDERVVIIDLDTGRVCGLNDTGSTVWSMVETRSREEMAQVLSSRHGRPIDLVAIEVDDFLSSVQERGWVGEAAQH